MEISENDKQKAIDEILEMQKKATGETSRTEAEESDGFSRLKEENERLKKLLFETENRKAEAKEPSETPESKTPVNNENPFSLFSQGGFLSKLSGSSDILLYALAFMLYGEKAESDLLLAILYIIMG